MKFENIDAFLSGELSGKSEKFFESSLRNDSELREEVFDQLRMHESLKILLEDQEESDDFADGVIAHLRSEGADLDAGNRGFAKSVLTEILEERNVAARLRWPDMVKAGLISAAAAIVAMFALQSVTVGNSRNDDLAVVGKEKESEESDVFVARVTGAEDVIWSKASESDIREDGWIRSRTVALESGIAEITFNSGAHVFLEGPARLSLDHANRGFLEYGKLTAEVPPRATGFVVNTPRLNVVDIGTRFGVSVDPNGDTEVHVMEGVIEASRASGNAVPVRLEEGFAVRADSRTRSELQPISYGGDQFELDVAEKIGESGYLHYDFEGTDAIIEDSGRGLDRGPFDATLIRESFSAPRRSPGKSGSGLVFQPGDQLSTRLSTQFELDEAFTISFWVKIAPRGPQTEDTAIMTLGRPELDHWRVLWNANTAAGAENALRIGFGDGHVIGTTDIRDGQWHHLTVRFLGGEEAKLSSHVHLFVDGEIEPISGVREAKLGSNRVGVMELGSFGESGFEGWIDEFYLHRGAISTPLFEKEEEIAENFLQNPESM